MSLPHFHRIQQRYANFTNGRHDGRWEKRINAAQRRYLRAVKTLARVRKMAGRAPLQINIAEKQTDAAGRRSFPHLSFLTEDLWHSKEQKAGKVEEMNSQDSRARGPADALDETL